MTFGKAQWQQFISVYPINTSAAYTSAKTYGVPNGSKHILCGYPTKMCGYRTIMCGYRTIMGSYHTNCVVTAYIVRLPHKNGRLPHNNVRLPHNNGRLTHNTFNPTCWYLQLAIRVMGYTGNTSIYFDNSQKSMNNNNYSLVYLKKPNYTL